MVVESFQENLEVLIKALNNFKHSWRVMPKEQRIASSLEIYFKKLLKEQIESERKGMKMSRDVMIYVIENNQIIESYYLGESGVYEYFPEGHFSMTAFLKLVTKFIWDIREKTVNGYADAWINNDILFRLELEDEIIDFIQAHPNANFQIRWE